MGKVTLLLLIKDAYVRMASNRDPSYRAQQMAKVDGWLEELSQLAEKDPQFMVREDYLI